VPALRDVVAKALSGKPERREHAERRFEEMCERHDSQRAAWEEVADGASDESPVAPAFLARELREVTRGDEWVIVAGTLSGWPHRLWEIDEYDKYTGGTSGGGGVGYQLGAAVGGALAYADTDRVPINFQADGDLLQFLGGLWTVSHHDIGLFTVVHNNGCLYNSTQHRMDLAGLRGREDSFERALVGTSTRDPWPDYAAIADAFDIAGYGPVTDPDDLRSTLESAWAECKGGEAALVDVRCQPR